MPNPTQRYTGVPTEAEEQVRICVWLRQRGILFCHPPNEGRRSRVAGARLRMQGLSAGVPDLLIFDRAPLAPDVRGVALEVKRRKGGRVSPAQRSWLDGLTARGWHAVVVRGADEAIAELTALGY